MNVEKKDISPENVLKRRETEEIEVIEVKDLHVEVTEGIDLKEVTEIERTEDPSNVITVNKPDICHENAPNKDNKEPTEVIEVIEVIEAKEVDIGEIEEIEEIEVIGEIEKIEEIEAIGEVEEEESKAKDGFIMISKQEDFLIIKRKSKHNCSLKNKVNFILNQDNILKNKLKEEECN